MKNGEQVLRLERVTREFVDGARLVNALGPVDLVLRDSESISLMGPNGCGKSTLLRLVAAIDQPTSGSIRRQFTPSDVIPFVFQDYRNSLLPWMRVRENLLFVLSIQGYRRRAAHKILADLLAQLDLNIDLEARPMDLSGGEAQRVAIVRALLVSPSIILLDEALSAIDYSSRREIRAFLGALCTTLERPPALIHVCHDIADAVYLGQRIVFFTPRPGRVHSVLENPLPWPRPADLESRPDWTKQQVSALAHFMQASELGKVDS